MKKLLMALALLPLMATAETWYDPSTGYTWLYSEKLGDTPGMWGGFICELNNEEIEIGPGERHQNKFAVSPAPTGAVVIPATINGFSVVSVGCAAFEDAALTAITIPSTVRYIGGWAISGCKKLKSVVVPESVVWIGEKAFDGCTALETVSLSEGLEYIDWNAFDGCVKLASITLPNSLQAIEEDAFIDCRALKLIYVSRAHADRLVGLLGKSGFDVAQVSVRYVGEEPDVKSYTLIPGEAVSIDTGLVGYTASGLPSGLKYDKKTGKITGAAKKPTAAEGVTVKFTKKGEAAAEMTIVVEKEKMSVGCAGLEGRAFMVGVAGGVGIPLEIETQSGVKSVKVTKLPAGMKYNAKTGLIEGAPTKAGDFTVQIAVTAKSGAVEKKDITIRVDPLPDWAVGTFSGMIGRRLGLSGEDGAAFYGSLQFTVKATGAVSAKVTAGGKTYSFSAKGFRGVEDGDAFLSRVNYPDADEVACRVSDTLVLDLATKKGDALLLGVTLFQKSGHLCVAKVGGMFVRSGCDSPYGLVAWRNEAGKDSLIAPGSPAAEAVARLKNLGKVYLKARELEPRADGARHFSLDWWGGEPLHRYGSKEADVTLSVDKSGIVKVSGKIDGVKLTASTPLRFSGNECFSVTADSIAYDKKSGMDYEFILGWDTIDPRTGVISVTPDPNADPLEAGPDMHGFELWVEPFE